MKTKRPPRSVWLLVRDGLPYTVHAKRGDALNAAAGAHLEFEVVGPYVLAERVGQK